tara:strand:+ start:339 stop:1748 length:1410 start_codon:yes stop_codon:yes gene_type:complete
MPKIPTFTAGRTEMTTQTASVGSNIQISPNSSMAAALLPAADAITNYAVKKRNATEALEAQKIVLELKSESDKLKYSQKDNINEGEAIENFSKEFNPLLKKKIDNVKNRRIKKLVSDNMILENAENIYTLKKQSFEAFEKESVRIYNNTQASNIGKYKTSEDPKLKDKYKSELYRAAEVYNDAHGLGEYDLKKRKETIDNALFITDAEGLIGTDDGVETIKKLDTGDKKLNNETFSKSLYNVYADKIESLTAKGDPNADFEQAQELLIEMEKFERSNGTKIIDGNREKKFADLKQKVLTESIAHDDLVELITQGKEVTEYKDAQKSALSSAFYNPMIMEKSGATAKALANEAKSEYDTRYEQWLRTNSGVSKFEKQQFAQELNFMLVDKYTEVDLTQLTTFNLDKNKFNIQRELNQVELAASYYFDNPDNPNMLKSLAKLNGYVDKKGNANVNAFLNFYLPLIKSRNKG